MTPDLRADIPAVCFIDDVARILRTSRRTIEKLRRHGCFPIRELASVDKRPRWSGVAVQRFITESDQARRTFGRRTA